jgi:hypothetical protein
MSTLIKYLSSDDIETRRSELLAEAGMSVEELRRRNDAFLLDPRQSAILRDIEDLDYLASASA